MEEVILVDELDNELGLMEKMKAHEDAKLHRAVSVLIFNSKGEMLIHKRADIKYHSAGLWTNASCTHPRKGETNIAAANRRLIEEMGISTSLIEKFEFIYKAELDNNLTEYELDHVFFGISDDLPILNPEEANDYKYINFDLLLNDIENYPQHYTEWFKIIINENSSLIIEYLKDIYEVA